jgi:hypothetical protein
MAQEEKGNARENPGGAMVEGGGCVMEVICVVDGCGKPLIARGLCHMHYRRLRKYGDVHVLKKPQMLDIGGQKFGRLLAVSKAGRTDKGERFWLCLCDCGNTKEITGSALVAGKIKSCAECGYSSDVTARFNRETKSIPADIRFDQSYEIDSVTGCWNWIKAVDQRGYGVFSENLATVKAHRFSWEKAFGKIPDGQGYHGTCVCHHCDNPACVNPDHLFLGSMQDNVDDMMAKGRHRTRWDTYKERTHGL